MAVNLFGYNVGTDSNVTISDAYGDIIPADLLGHVMDFEMESEDTELKIVPISNGGVPIYQTIPGGYRGKCSLARVNGNLQAMVAELWNAYHSQGLITQLSISQNVLNRDGTIDEYLWSNVQIAKPRFGNYRHEKEVDMSFDIRASVLTVVGGATAFLTGLDAIAA
jgi:hypothetical protein